MDLKELLGEELYSQVEEKAGKHKLAVVSDGNWFPKEKFDEKNEDVKELKRQLEERDTQLNQLSKKAKGNEELEQQIKQLQEDNKQATEEYQQKLEKQAFDFALEKAISEAKARNPKAVKALLNTEVIKLDGEKLIGFDEQLKGLQESDAYLFGTEETKKLNGREPVVKEKSSDGLSKEQFSQMPYADRVKLYNEKPDLYKKLSE